MKFCLLILLFTCTLSVGLPARGAEPTSQQRQPNIVYIMSDELAYYELEHMGNPYLRTPRIDQMAREGMRFTSALAGSPVCASLRCALMTGKHMGHASVRSNGPDCSLRADEVTIAMLLKEGGYATGGYGKWGIGGRGSNGIPEKHGFDDFFGYYDQVHAHTYYPPYLVRQSQEVPLAGNRGGRQGETYSHYEIMREGLQFLRDHQDKPFFCYLPITPTHSWFDIPADDPAWQQYQDDAWMQDPKVSQDAKNYAAMVTMMDNDLGQILDLLRDLNLEQNTIVFFTGDNGGYDRFASKQQPGGFFGPNVDPNTGIKFRGSKGNLYDGGLRIPFIVRWPGKIAPGQVSDFVFYHPDVYPTLAELAGLESPPEIDGISILPTILGTQAVGRPQEIHPYLYWEHRDQVAVRIGNWKGIQPKQNAHWELYDLANDPAESSNVAQEHPDLIAKLKRYASEAHEPLRAGSYADRTLHEKDRLAKGGAPGK